MAEALAVNGAAKVFLLGRRQDVLQQSAAKYPNIMVPVPCDVTSKASLQAAVDVVTKTVGYINLLIANSGTNKPAVLCDPSMPLAQLRNHLMQTPMEDFTQTFHVNVTGAWFTMVAFLELLDAGNKHAVAASAAAGEGVFGAPTKKDGKVPSIQSQVVFTASLSAVSRAWMSPPNYASSKAAVVHLMKQASTNLARFGIRANALAPGCMFSVMCFLLSRHYDLHFTDFPSDMTIDVVSKRNPEDEGPDNVFFIPSQKFGGEEEMAGAILYLASRAGSFTNGNVLLCDGGRMAVIPGTY